MKTTLLIILSVMGAYLVLGIYLLWSRSYRVNKFRSRLRTGELCTFYLCEEKEVGNVISIDGDHIIVSDANGDRYPIHITNIYPYL